MRKNKLVELFDHQKIEKFINKIDNRTKKINIPFDGNGARKIANLIKSKFLMSSWIVSICAGDQQVRSIIECKKKRF